MRFWSEMAFVPPCVDVLRFSFFLSPQTQFVLTIFQTSCGVVWPCAFPQGWLYFQIFYMISLIILFTNFYIQVKVIFVNSL